MEFKDYYDTLGVARKAGADEIKRAYRKLARKYHPDVSKETDAERRFKEVSEAYEALSDPERRAAYDDASARHAQARTSGFEPPPGWDSGYAFSGADADFGPGDGRDYSDFFEAMFGHARRGRGGMPGAGGRHATAGGDHHARIVIDLADSYRGAQRTVTLRMPMVDAQGVVSMRERTIDVSIPKGVREGQHLRLAGLGQLGANGPPGDLYIEIAFRPDPRFRVDGRDVYVDLPLAPWEAGQGAAVTAPTPNGSVQITVPAGSSSGRKLRLRGLGLPGTPPGDLYAVIAVRMPAVDSAADHAAASAAYDALAQAFSDFKPRGDLE